MNSRPRSARRSPPVVQWTRSGENTWVAALSDDYLGMVEMIDGGYVANDTARERYRSYRSLAEAMLVFEPEPHPPKRRHERENHSHRVLAPFFWAWFRDRTGQQSEWLYPTGPAEASVAGPDPLQILVIGDGPAAGYGVHTHELGIAGHLARDLRARTRRGVNVRVHAGPASSARSILMDAGGISVDGYDAIILMLANTDAFCLTPTRAWRRDLSALLRILQAGGSAVSVTTTASLEFARALSPLGRRLTGSHANMLDRETERISADLHAPLISLDAASDLNSRTYAMWSRRIGAVVSRSL